jgi:hypothetical protein
MALRYFEPNENFDQMKISVADLEKFGRLYTSRDIIDKIIWNVAKGAISSIAKYKLLGIRGKM